MSRWRNLGRALLLLMPVLTIVAAAEAERLSRWVGFGLGAGPLFGAGLAGFLLLGFFALAPSPQSSHHRGTQWTTGLSRWQLSGRIAALPGALSCLAFVIVGGLELELALASSMAGVAFAAVTALALVERLLRGDANAPKVLLDAQTLTIQSDRGMKVFRYDVIRSVERQGSTVWLTAENDRMRIPVSGGEARAEALLTAVLERVRSSSTAGSREVGGPVALLRRADGSSARDWLTQIDALAGSVDGGSAYRGAGIDQETLLTTLDDPHARADTRVAAARLLARSANQEVKVRVATAIGRVEEEDLRVRIELGMKPDLEEAASEIEAMDLDATAREVGR